MQIKAHLTPEQRRLLLDWLENNPVRPSTRLYQVQDLFMQGTRPKTKPKLSQIPNVRPGFEASEVVPLVEFDATKDLPPGWALVTMMDSGYNHKVENAGTAVLRFLWNTWGKGVIKPCTHSLDTLEICRCKWPGHEVGSKDQ